MPVVARRITSTGSLYLSNTIDEVSTTTIRLTTDTFYVSEFNEVSLVTSPAYRESSTGIVYTSGELSELSIPYHISRLPFGEVSYTLAGSYSWICPADVYYVHVVCIGGGGGSVAGAGYNGFNQGGGAGGGNGWKNNIPVVPGQSYTVQVGAAGSGGSRYATLSAGGDSYFISTATVKGGGGGAAYGEVNGGIGGSYTGDGGGNGGGGGTSFAVFTSCAGGGAGGYTGSGGQGEGDQTANTAGSGGGGGGGATMPGYTGRYSSGGGGGVGILGQGANGSTPASQSGAGGGGGSGGGSGTQGTNGFNSAVGGSGGSYGGGAGSAVVAAYSGEISGQAAAGAVRIIWGAGRSFPSTNTGDV